MFRDWDGVDWGCQRFVHTFMEAGSLQNGIEVFSPDAIPIPPPIGNKGLLPYAFRIASHA